MPTRRRENKKTDIFKGNWRRRRRRWLTTALYEPQVIIYTLLYYWRTMRAYTRYNGEYLLDSTANCHTFNRRVYRGRAHIIMLWWQQCCWYRFRVLLLLVLLLLLKSGINFTIPIPRNALYRAARVGWTA